MLFDLSMYLLAAALFAFLAVLGLGALLAPVYLAVRYRDALRQDDLAEIKAELAALQKARAGH